MWRIVALVCAAVALPGCAMLQTLTEPGATVVIAKVQCPPLKAYPPEFQTKAAAERKALPANSAVGTLVDDLGTLRAKCRAYEAKPAIS